MDALTIAAIGMQDDLARLNSISQNLANVMTPGYKRAVPFSQSFSQYMEGAASLSPLTSVAAGTSASQTAFDPAAGTLRHTGNTLDVAIDGDGYFEVMTDSGAAYTRQGTLHIDARGRLVTAQGHPVMGVGGELSISGNSATIERNGDVRQGDQIVGQLKLMRFANPERMTVLGNGLFAQGGARLADTGVAGTVRAGYQESSNVNAPREMVRLTETIRHFESMQKVFQGYDEAMEKAIRKLGEF